MRAREFIYEASDPRVVAMQTAMQKAGAKNADGTPLTIDGQLGPNTQTAMASSRFARFVPRDLSLALPTNSGPHPLPAQQSASVGTAATAAEPAVQRPQFPHTLTPQQQAQNTLQPGYNSVDLMGNQTGGAETAVDANQAKVMDKGMTVVIGDQARKKGDANWRNNNPGNIGAGATARGLGSIGANGRWAIFPDLSKGFQAMHDLLMSPAYNTLTAKQAVYKWAPPNENNTAFYVDQMAKAGLNMDQPYSKLTPAQQQLYQQTVNRIEGGHAGQVVAATATTTPTA